MRLRSSGTVTSVQSSVSSGLALALDLDLDEELCFFELELLELEWCLELREDI